MDMRNLDSRHIVEGLLVVIANRRHELGISHETVAKRAGLHRSTISLIERGLRVPTIYTCLVIFKALEMPLVTALVEAERISNEKNQ